MTYDQYIEVINYLNVRLHNWYTPEMGKRKWTWAEVGFLAAWMGFRFKGEK